MCGVKEYIIWRTRVSQIERFVLPNGKYQRIEPIDD